MKPIQKILTDLVQHIKNEEPIKPIHKHQYSYDRMDWVKNNLSKQDDLYDIGLENLRVLVYQLSLFNQHILTNQESKEINKKPRRNNEE
jgi:hypothetical protein